MMIETEGQCLKMNSASEVYENALINQQELSVLNGYDKLVGQNVLMVEAAYDTVAPPEKMLRPLADKLMEEKSNIRYITIKSNHSFIGQRMKLTRIVGQWIEDIL